MYLTKTNEWEIIKKQYKYKLQSYPLMFMIIVVAQSVSIFLSSTGAMSMYSSNGSNLSLQISVISSDNIIFFTLFSILIMTISFTGSETRSADFTFVTNRLTSNLANIGFIVTLCLFGAITSVLSGVLLRVIIYFRVGAESIIPNDFFVSFHGWLMLLIVTFLYFLLLSSLSYFIGVFMQFNKLIVAVVAVVVIGSLISEVRITGRLQILQLFISETSLFEFACKVILTAIVLFACVLYMSNRVEVRK